MMSQAPPRRAELNQRIKNYEEERTMPFLSYLEEDAIKKGEQRGRITSQLLILEPLLQARFGEHGLLLMPRIRCINDFDRLLQITLAIIANKDLSEITQLIPE